MGSKYIIPLQVTNLYKIQVGNGRHKTSQYYYVFYYPAREESIGQYRNTLHSNIQYVNSSTIFLLSSICTTNYENIFTVPELQKYTTVLPANKNYLYSYWYKYILNSSFRILCLINSCFKTNKTIIFKIKFGCFIFTCTYRQTTATVTTMDMDEWID